MPERPKEFAPLPTFDPAKYYIVQLYRAVEWHGRHFSPVDKLTLSGDVAKEIADAIYTAEESKEQL